MSLSSVQHAPPTHYQLQCGHGADCPARCLATIKSRRRRASQLLLRLPATPAWQLEEGRNIEMTGCTSEFKQPLSTPPSRLHQFCTSRQQLPPTTWHAGGQLSRRPLRWLAEEQSRLLNRRLRASAIGPDHLLASGTKDQAVGPLSRARRGTRSTIAFLRLDLREKRDLPQRIFKRK